MESLEALRWRYATKQFDTDRILPDEKVQKLKQAFNLTATSYGLQPLRLVMVHNKELQEKLQSHTFNQKQIGTASHLLILCIEKKVGQEFIDNHFRNESDIRKTPEDVLGPFRNRLITHFEQKPTEEIRIWAINQAYLVLGSLLTVCALEGIDSCPMEGFQPEKYDEVLKLEEQNLNSVLVLPVGYRAKEDVFAKLKKVRRPLDEVVIEVGDKI